MSSEQPSAPSDAAPDTPGAASPAGVITDPKDARLAKVRELLKGRNKGSRAIIIDDEEPLAEALRHGVTVFTVFHGEDTQLPAAVTDLLPADADVQVVSTYAAKELFGVERRSRIFALARRPKPLTVAELLEHPGDVAVLDGVKLMGNIGAVTRSAKALGFAGLILVDSDLASVTDRRLVRASRGMVFALPLALATADDVVAHLSEAGVPLVSLDPEAREPLSGIAGIEGRLALLLGSEKRGASSRLEQAAERSVRIDIHPDVESLNVSVSAALAMYERRGANPLPSPSEG